MELVNGKRNAKRCVNTDLLFLTSNDLVNHIFIFDKYFYFFDKYTCQKEKEVLQCF